MGAKIYRLNFWVKDTPDEMQKPQDFLKIGVYLSNCRKLWIKSLSIIFAAHLSIGRIALYFGCVAQEIWQIYGTQNSSTLATI